MEVRTRFAPSPTGLMHIGNVRTALYAFLVARKNNGIFILRIEDTDRERFVPGATQEIMETLKWLGIIWDEGPIYQSQRLPIYQEHAERLIKDGFAYKKDGAVWFKTTKDGETSWTDLVGNRVVTIKNETQDDFVMIKSDGYPTYNFAVVVDDYLMKISHIIRGVEFISSTPKHLMIYRAFNWPVPVFAHLPIFLGSDRSKLSKRHGAKAASEFRKDGFLPEAILNYMALLSWTPPDNKELVSVDEMIKLFDLSAVHITNPIFDTTKLEWMNGKYIRKTQNSKLKTQIIEYLQELSSGLLSAKDHQKEEKIEKLVPLVKERINKLSDFIPLTNFIFEKPGYDINVFQIAFGQKNQKGLLNKILEVMKSLKRPWEAKEFEIAFRKLAEDEKIKAGDLFQLIRVAISGQGITPPLFESIKLIGEDEVISRVKYVIDEVIGPAGI